MEATTTETARVQAMAGLDGYRDGSDRAVRATE